MPTQLQLRRGTTTEHSTFSGAVGEVTVDTTKDTLIVHDGATNGGFPLAKEAGATFGNTNVTGNFSFADNAKAQFGAGSDLQIYHDVSNSWIEDNGTGNLYLKTANGASIRFLSGATNKAMFVANSDSSVDLYHDNAPKLATTATGVDVTGTVTSDGLNVQGGTVTASGLTVDGTGGQITTDNNGHIISKQSLDVGTAGGRFIGKSNRGELGHIAIEQTATGADGGYIRFSTSPSGSTSPTEHLRITSAGNAGIGTTSPNSKLDVTNSTSNVYTAANTLTGDQTARLVNFDTTLNTSSTLLFVSSAGGGSGLATISGVGVASGSMDLTFANRNAGGNVIEHMRINSAGSVGIGTTSPSGRLHVSTPSSSGTEVAARFSSSTDASGMKIERSGSSWRVASQSALILGADYDANSTGSDSTIIFETDATERMSIDSIGRVKIASPSNNATPFNVRSLSTSQYVADFSVKTNGYGIYLRNASETVVGTIIMNAGGAAFNETSDYRLKENVTYDWDATTRLKQLKPAQFNFISTPDETRDGFLAHEVQEVSPQSVTGTKDAMMDEEYEVTPAVLDEDGNEVTPAVMGTRSVPNYQGIDQSKLVPLLVKTIQELEARITALEAN